MNDGGFVIEGEANVRAAQHVAQVSALAMQARGLLKGRPGFVSAMAAKVGSTSRTSKPVLEDVVIWGYRHGVPLGAVWNTVERGLGEARCAKLRRKCEKIEKELAK